MHTSTTGCQVARAVFTTAAICGAAAAQDTPARFDQLKAQYKLVKIGFLGNTSSENATKLLVQKEGIFGVGVHGLANPTATYANGVLHSPGKTAALLSAANNTHWFQVNEQVYPMKFEPDLKADRVTVTIVSSDYAYKGRVHFQFSRGGLSTASNGEIQDLISQVLSIDDGSAKPQAPAPQTPTAPTGASVNQPPAELPATQFQPIPPPPSPQVDQHQPAPRRFWIGQSTEDVLAILGQPEKIVDMGTKVIYVYHDLKITFVNGKSMDIQ